MSVILGIDAAWTDHNPSGVALVQNAGKGWQCVVVAPSYSSFTAYNKDQDIDWEATPAVGRPRVSELLEAAERICGAAVDVIAVDMPLATTEITGRRCADKKVSRCFGARKCATHSPTQDRPGEVSRTLYGDCNGAGYVLATKDMRFSNKKTLIEVYPHTALLGLLRCQERVPYKAGKTLQYWPEYRKEKDKGKERRRIRLLREWKKILDGLRGKMDEIDLPLPRDGSFRSLKRYEDAIDALLCAYVGMEFMEGRAYALGDDTAAIWHPLSAQKSRD